MHQFSFEKLQVWKEAKEFTSYTYRITNEFPEIEKFGLTNQIRRAVVSVVSNIAEGSTRETSKDQGRFYVMAYSSLMEVLSHYLIAIDLGFISEVHEQEIRKHIEKIANKLNALKKSTQNRKTTLHQKP